MRSMKRRHPRRAPAPGKFMVVAPEHSNPQTAITYWRNKSEAEAWVLGALHKDEEYIVIERRRNKDKRFGKLPEHHVIARGRNTRPGVGPGAKSIYQR